MDWDSTTVENIPSPVKLLIEKRRILRLQKRQTMMKKTNTTLLLQQQRMKQKLKQSHNPVRHRKLKRSRTIVAGGESQRFSESKKRFKSASSSLSSLSAAAKTHLQESRFAGDPNSRETNARTETGNHASQQSSIDTLVDITEDQAEEEQLLQVQAQKRQTTIDFKVQATPLALLEPSKTCTKSFSEALVYSMVSLCIAGDPQAVKEMLYDVCDDRIVKACEKVCIARNKEFKNAQGQNQQQKQFIDDPYNPLWQASKLNQADLVKSLLEAGFPADGFHSDCTKTSTPLYVAAHMGHSRVVELLCQAGANVNFALDSDGASVLYLACKKGNLETVRTLGKFKVDANVCKHNGMSPLHVASQNGFSQLCELLIQELGANVHLYSLSGSTPVHLAAYQKHVGVVRVLIENGCNVDARDTVGWTPMHVASQGGPVEIVKMLATAPVVASSSLCSEAKTIAMDIVAQGYTEKSKTRGHSLCEELVKSDTTVIDSVDFDPDLALVLRLNRRKNDLYTPLMVAIRSVADLSVFKFLLENGASVRTELNDAVTPLMVSCKYGNLAQLKELCKHLERSDFEASTSAARWSPLHWVVKSGQVDSVKELIQHLVSHGIFDVDAAVVNGMTPLYIAAHNGHVEVVKTLVLEYNADVAKGMANGGTALYTACKHGHKEVVRFLILRGNVPHSALRNSRGTPLHTASKYNRLDLVKLLVEELDFDPITAVSAQGWNAVHTAARSGSFEVMEYFCDKVGASVISSCKSTNR